MLGRSDSLSSASSNTKSVGDEFEMEEVTHDEYNYDDNIDGAVRLDGIDEIAVDNNAMKCVAITPNMIEKSLRHVCTAMAQRQYLHDCVADSKVDVNNNASHAEKHYIFICDYAQNMELPFLGDQTTWRNLLLDTKKCVCLRNGQHGTFLQ
jgi:hypothetical protein